MSRLLSVIALVAYVYALYLAGIDPLALIGY